MSDAHPTFDKKTNTVSLPDFPGVEYRIDGNLATGDVVINRDVNVSIRPARGYRLSPRVRRDHFFRFNPTVGEVTPTPAAVSPTPVDPEADSDNTTNEAVDSRNRR